MNGNNKLIINQATMLEALQYYIEKIFAADPIVTNTVTSVKSDGDTFVVGVTSEHSK